MAADRWAAPAGPGGPRALRAAQRKEGVRGDGVSIRGASSLSVSRHPHGQGARSGMAWVRARAIGTARLNPSRGLHLRPVDQVFYLGPYRKEN